MATTNPRYLLDTDVTSILIDKRRSAPVLRRRVLSLAPDRLFLSPVTVEEVMRGALNAIRVAQSRKGDIVEAYSHFVRLFAGIGEFSILPYTEDAEHIYKAFPPHIKRIGTNDCRIAATAQAHGCVLITVNVTDFRQIEGLQVEDWTEGIQQ